MRLGAALVLMVTLLSWTAPGVRADDPCAGMDAYEHDILDAGRHYGEWLIASRFSERDATTLSSPEWTELAEHVEDTQTAFKTITPPAGVAGWHDFQIESQGFQSTLGRSAASMGILTAALALQEQAETLDARSDKAKSEAIKACPDFADVYMKWDALDQTPATPVASPTP